MASPPPEDFRCPISLELMNDPVILSTGQTYDRSSIQRWLDAGHRTCPKTKQVLYDMKLIPNYALRSLIHQWASTNSAIDLNMSAPENFTSRSSHTTVTLAGARCLTSLKAIVEGLIRSLSDDSSLRTQRDAMNKLSELATQCKQNRDAIVEAGGIAAILSQLMSGGNPEVEEAGLQSLLALSLDDENKVGLVAEGAVDVIVKSLEAGFAPTRIKAAATLTSLVLVDVNKVTIGSHPDAIAGLVRLLAEGDLRAKKQAMSALGALCTFRGNKRKAVVAGVVPLLLAPLVDCRNESLEHALTVLDILSTSAEGKVAIMREPALPTTLTRLLRSGTARSKEHAAAVLWSLCADNKKFASKAVDAGALVASMALMQSSTDRARRKASLLVKAFRECAG